MLLALSLILLATLLLSILRPQLNPGLLAMAAAYLALPFLPPGSPTNPAQLFPTSLFLTLLGVTLFFSCLDATGLIEKILKIILKKTTLYPKLIALVLFLLVSFLTASGLGNIATVALLAPIALPLANELGIPKLAMTILIVGGANAASFSPLCLPGIVINDFIAKSLISREINSSLPLRWIIFWGVFSSISAITWTSFFFLKGKKIKTDEQTKVPKSISLSTTPSIKFDVSPSKTREAAFITITLAIVFIGANVVLAMKDFLVLQHSLFSVITSFSSVSLICWLGAVFLLLLNVTTLEIALKRIPWSTILMVTGMSTFIELLTQLGLAQVLSQSIKTSIPEQLLPSVFASSAALLSAFSSSVGVALPTFLPLAEAITQAAPNADGRVILLSLAVGSHVVDASPLSTLGALCLAQVQKENEKNFIYKWLLIYSFCMIPVSAILALLFTTIL